MHFRGQIEVLAITLVGGNTSLDNCASNAMRILETVGKADEVSLNCLDSISCGIFGCLVGQV